MKCGRMDGLVEAYVDGRFPAPLTKAVETHLGSCARCRLRVETARLIAGSLSEAPAVRAPEGFADKVMNAVYRAALSGATGAAGAPARIPTRSYRRMGLSFVLTAAILTVSLFIPAAAYPRLMGPASGAAVKNAIDGAGRVVRGALRSYNEGGTTR
jgi:anti-sigma factor RsiW